MEENSYWKILSDYKLALEFKKRAIGVFRGKTVKTLEELSRIFHEIDGKYTLDQAREFINNLSVNKNKWHYGSFPRTSNYISFNQVKGDFIKAKVNRVAY